MKESVKMKQRVRLVAMTVGGCIWYRSI